MQPGKFDLTLYRGDSYEWQFVLWQDEDKTVPVDLTGATVAAEIRDKTAGRTVIDLQPRVDVSNVVTIRVTPDMYKRCPARGVWDLQILFPDGHVHTPIYGTVTVTGDVTQSLPMASK
jgi:hypothetical protein